MRRPVRMLARSQSLVGPALRLVPGAVCFYSVATRAEVSLLQTYRDNA